MQVERYIPEPYMLHSKNPQSDVCESGYQEVYISKHDPRTGILEFVVEGNAQQMIDPRNIFLWIECQLSGKALRGATTKTEHQIKENTGDDDGAKVGFINNVLQSLFESVEVYVNGQLLSKNDKHHHYCGYLQTLCSNSYESLDRYGAIHGWKDTGLDVSMDGEDNFAMKSRRSFMKAPDFKGELIGKLCHPLFIQKKLLPSQVSLRIVCKKTPDSFLLMHEEGTFEMKILNAKLLVQKVKVIPALTEAYNKMLEENKPIPYFLRTPYVKYFTIEKGASQFVRDDIFLGEDPKHVIIGMVETAAYQGARAKNPYNFQHFKLERIVLSKDGFAMSPVLEMDFVKQKGVREAYHRFLTSLNIAYNNFSPAFRAEDFSNGYTLFSYDMSPDQMGSTHPGALMKMHSNIRLEMKFQTPVTENITVLVYHELDHLMEIHQNRSVKVTF